MQMEKGLDTGPVLLHQRSTSARTKPPANCTIASSTLGAQVLADGLGLLRADMRPVPRPQPGRRRDLRAQARESRSAPGLDAAGRRARAQGARVRSVADRRRRDRRRERAHPSARSRSMRRGAPGQRARARAATASTSPAAKARCASACCNARAARRSPPPITSTRAATCASRRMKPAPGVALRIAATQTLDAVLHHGAFAQGRTRATPADARRRARSRAARSDRVHRAARARALRRRA